MMRWWSDPELHGGTARRFFGTMDQALTAQGEEITRDPQSRVVRVEYESRRYYVKCYKCSVRSSRRWFGLYQWVAPPRVEKEWQNLLRFQQLGIPTARLAAYGIERRFGRFLRGAVVTEEIADATDLLRLANQKSSFLRDRGWVAVVSSQVAEITRRMHGAGFVHNDLKWRNLLVTHGDAPQVYLIDCPGGGIWWGPFLQYRIVKDLACLDKVAKYHLTRTQRLRFYLNYVQRRRLREADKKRLRRIVKFFEGRE